MTEKTIRVGIIMGSDSDWPKIHGVADALDEFKMKLVAKIEKKDAAFLESLKHVD